MILKSISCVESGKKNPNILLILMQENDDHVKIKPHSVKRIYKAGTWQDLQMITCNKCFINKTKVDFPIYRYTCKACLAVKVSHPIDTIDTELKSTTAAASDASSSATGASKAARRYKNGSWGALDNIVCGRCQLDKPKSAYKVNRYVCIDCSNALLKEHNQHKDGKYQEAQKEYNSKYERSEHGQARRAEYREKLKEIRAQNASARVRQPNPMNRLRIYTFQRVLRALNVENAKPSAVFQYLGISLDRFKQWMEFNFDDATGATNQKWENLGSVWKPDLVTVESNEIGEQYKYDILNWKNWSPTNIDSNDPRDCRHRSMRFLEDIAG